jgi:hypothetical protein
MKTELAVQERAATLPTDVRLWQAPAWGSPLIGMHGGRIWLESQVGQGSTFAFTLPVVVEQQVNVEPK